MIWFPPGQARVQTREFQGAIQPFENFLKNTADQKAPVTPVLARQGLRGSGECGPRAPRSTSAPCPFYPGSDFRAQLPTG